MRVAAAGLGGYNSGPAGVFHALANNKIKPDIISLTSGQIIIGSKFLNNESIEEYIEKLVDITNNFNLNKIGYFNIDPLSIADYLLNPFRNEYKNIFNSLPTKIIEHNRSDNEYKKIFDIFMNTSTGVLFNSCDMKTGIEIVYYNKNARDQIQMFEGCSENRVYVELKNFEQVKNALWLNFYTKNRENIDGVYRRSMIISELLYGIGNDKFLCALAIDGKTNKIPENMWDNYENSLMFQFTNTIDVEIISENLRRKMSKETPLNYHKICSSREWSNNNAFKETMQSFYENYEHTLKLI